VNSDVNFFRETGWGTHRLDSSVSYSTMRKRRGTVIRRSQLRMNVVWLSGEWPRVVRKVTAMRCDADTLMLGRHPSKNRAVMRQDQDLFRHRVRRARQPGGRSGNDLPGHAERVCRGAHGIVISREYEEMKVEHLRAVGRAVREVSR
jgi:hypothetical protein